MDSRLNGINTSESASACVCNQDLEFDDRHTPCQTHTCTPHTHTYTQIRDMRTHAGYRVHKSAGHVRTKTQNFLKNISQLRAQLAFLFTHVSFFLQVIKAYIYILCTINLLFYMVIRTRTEGRKMVLACGKPIS